MPVERIDLGKGSYSNVEEISTRSGVSALLQNGYIDDLGSNVKIWGGELWSSFLFGGVTGGRVHGMFYSTTLQTLIVVHEGTVYSIDSDGNQTELTGETLTPGPRVEFFEAPALTQAGVYGPNVFMANGGSIYYTDGSTVSKLTGTNAPSACRAIKFIDYQLIAQYDKRFFVHSEPNDLLNLGDSTNLIAADSSPDDIVGIATANRELIVFGKRSIDTFYYSSIGTTATWVKTPGGFNPDYGCAASGSIVEFGNAVFFLDHKREVCQYSGRQVKVLSTSISMEIEQLTTVSDAIADKVDFNGKHFYWLTFPTENKTFVYDMVMDCWYRMGDWDNDVGVLNAHPMNAYAYNDDANLYLGGTRDGVISKLNTDATIFLNETSRFIRRSGFINWGTDRRHKRCNMIAFRVKSGQELSLIHI